MQGLGGRAVREGVEGVPREGERARETRARPRGTPAHGEAHRGLRVCSSLQARRRRVWFGGSKFAVWKVLEKPRDIRHGHRRMGQTHMEHAHTRHVHTDTRGGPSGPLGEAYGEEVAAVSSILEDGEGVGVRDGGGEGGEVVGVEGAGGRAGGAVGGGVDGATRARLPVKDATTR